MAMPPLPTPHVRIPRPQPGEYDPAYAETLARVAGDDALPVLAAQEEDVTALLGGLSEERALYRYAPGKWSVKVVVGHLSDSERVFSYGVLRERYGLREPARGG